jgi:DNA repair protein RadA/Sms
MEGEPVSVRGQGAKSSIRGAANPVPLRDVNTQDAPRILTSDGELNRVLGGGIVPGSVVLLGGEPGVGKSTLLLQVAQNLRETGRKVLYVSGEESVQQIKMRADRLQHGAAGQEMGGLDSQELPGDKLHERARSQEPGAKAPRSERSGVYREGESQPPPGEGQVYLLAESSLEKILEAVDDIHPTDLIIDSIQTTYSEGLDSSPGSISQVRHVATRLLNVAKSSQMPVFMIGHVTKDGTLAGPKALEHIVDAVLYFEGERHHNHRIVRAVKNRFGAANEVGIFEMTSHGLAAVQNPSVLFLRDREASAPGSSVTCALEGTRPILVEIQALVVPTQFGTARRTSTGVDYNRIALLVAMLEKRIGVSLMSCDIYVNAAGGLEIDEPGSDLAVAAAILSSFRNRALDPHMVLLGELSLAGEVRPVSQAHLRVREAAAMGFKKCFLPAGNLPLLDREAIEQVGVRTVSQLSDLLF